MRKFIPFNRQIRIIRSLVILCIFISCNNEGAHTHENTVAQKNLEAVRVINKAFDTGDTSEIDNVQISRLRDGKIVEHWEAMDMQDMMKLMPPMNMPDTSKN